MLVVVELPITFSEEKSTDSNAVQPPNAYCIAVVPVMDSNPERSTVFSFVQPLKVYDQHEALMVVNAGNEAVTMFVELAKA